MDNESVKVLLIDDDEDDFIITSELLSEIEERKYNLEWIATYEAGLDAMKQSRHDVYLIDYRLGERSGLELVRESVKSGCKGPMIFLTGQGDHEVDLQAMKAGVADFLNKAQIDAYILERSIRYAMVQYRILTELEQKTKQLEASEKNIRTIIEKSVDAIVIVDNEQIIHFANPAAELLFESKANDLVGSRFDFPVGGGGKKELNIINRRGESVTVEMRVVPIEWKAKKTFLISLHDITELVQLGKKLHAMAVLDDLTDLYNRRGFLTLADQQIKIANRSKRGFLLFYGDLDGMKWINDTLGHLEGDTALIEAANVLKETFRDSDIIGRIGGDEFVVLAVDTFEKNEEVLLARLHANLEVYNERKMVNEKGELPYKLSLSLGIAHYDPDQPCSIDELLARADRMMYEQKRHKQQFDAGSTPGS